MKHGTYILSGLVLVLAGFLNAAEPAWKPADNPLMTRWAQDVTPAKVLPEYPRPQLVRKDWLNLNGLWDYAVRPREEGQPHKWDGKLLVPFCIESALSGVKKSVSPQQKLWYRRTFTLDPGWSGRRLLLHFGAVDWHAVVWVNGRQVGEHRGGYDPFTFDISSAVKTGGANHELVVSVWDPTDTAAQPRGKQVLKPGGIWYTAVTGIWQTVWLEPVPETYIQRLKIMPDLDAKQVVFTLPGQMLPAEARLQVEVTLAGKRVAQAKGPASAPLRVTVPDPKPWSPDSPSLYDVAVTLTAGKATDRVASYFGLRKIEIKKDDRGVNRLFLNHQPLFQYGPLDQGWWPDGLYTAPTDAALRYDIEITKQLGFNMARKHVKVEPARWYYWCDRLGLLVWQDMPSGMIGRKGVHHVTPKKPKDAPFTAEEKAVFRRELEAMLDGFGHHPSIVMWVVFNEGWGQHDTAAYTEFVRKQDPTRLVNNPSGWLDRGVGDVHDIHRYPGPDMPPREEKRAAVLGEFGGLGLPLKGHLWQEKDNWGYRTYKTRAELTREYVSLLKKMQPLLTNGLAAAVYTQTTDVEIEVNGLLTYDRKLIKLDAKAATDAARALYGVPAGGTPRRSPGSQVP